MSKPSFLNQPPETAVAFADAKRTKEITTLSPRQQDRLENEGRFPRSIKLGSGRNGRKARVLQEVIDWNRARIAERDGQAA
jgi:predicted DNA-binding transcriptional regulator AlpA